MNRLTCEVCGGSDLIKQDGVFVCQSCGCKYSLEEVRKMMIEGTVEVTGTVKVDNSALIDNYLVIARNALKARNNKEAEDYCNKILEIDVNNWEAWLFKGAAVARRATSEATVAFSRAREICPAEEQEKFKSDFKNYARIVIDDLSTKWESIRENAKTISFDEEDDDEGDTIYFDDYKDAKNFIKSIDTLLDGFKFVLLLCGNEDADEDEDTDEDTDEYDDVETIALKITIYEHMIELQRAAIDTTCSNVPYYDEDGNYCGIKTEPWSESFLDEGEKYSREDDINDWEGQLEVSKLRLKIGKKKAY